MTNLKDLKQMLRDYALLCGEYSDALVTGDEEHAEELFSMIVKVFKKIEDFNILPEKEVK